MIWSFYWLSFVIWFDLFQCRISGKPSPAVKWVLNGRIISNLSSPPHASRWHPFQSQEFQKKFKHPGGFNFFLNSLPEVQGSSSIQVASTSLELLWTDFVNISNASSSPLERLYSIREVATAAGNTLILLQVFTVILAGLPSFPSELSTENCWPQENVSLLSINIEQFNQLLYLFQVI